MSSSDRAKQFMPFATLRGYYGEVRKKEKIYKERRELLEEEAIELSKKVVEIKKGDVYRILYYEDGGYIETTGAITQIDLTLKTLSVVKKKINFTDIYGIEKA